MESWDLKTVEVEPHQPRILASADDARTIVLQPAGGGGDAGARGARAGAADRHRRRRRRHHRGGADFANAGAGHLFEFDPGERRTIVARSDARLLYVLSPWPGDGHPGAMTLEEKSEAREKAAEQRGLANYQTTSDRGLS